MTTDAANKNAEAAELDKLRAEIDRLDQELVERIHARSKVAMEVGEVKKRYSDNPVFLRPGREASMLRRAATERAFLDDLCAKTRALQPMVSPAIERAGYLGDLATIMPTGVAILAELVGVSSFVVRNAIVGCCSTG